MKRHMLWMEEKDDRRSLVPWRYPWIALLDLNQVTFRFLIIKKINCLINLIEQISNRIEKEIFAVIKVYFKDKTECFSFFLPTTENYNKLKDVIFLFLFLWDIKMTESCYEINLGSRLPFGSITYINLTYFVKYVLRIK